MTARRFRTRDLSTDTSPDFERLFGRHGGVQGRGWCPYGRRDELPRIDGGLIHRSLGLPEEPGDPWRIACFFVDRDFRRRGVSRAALAAIRRRGGGTVEAYPATHRRAVAT